MKLEFAEHALRDIERLRKFIAPHNPDAARHAVLGLLKAAGALTQFPLSSPIVPGRKNIRDKIVSFGNYGYVIRYHIKADTVYVMRI